MENKKQPSDIRWYDFIPIAGAITYSLRMEKTRREIVGVHELSFRSSLIFSAYHVASLYGFAEGLELILH